jgi:hypothetical protein
MFPITRCRIPWRLFRLRLEPLEDRITPAAIPFIEPPPIAHFVAANSVTAADVDGDGDLDVLGTVGGAVNDVLWFENTTGDGSAWTQHAIDDSFQGANHVTAADLDGDGDLDVLATATTDGMAWWENTAGDGSAWTEHAIDGGSGVQHGIAADLDGDGDLDVLSAGGGEVTWWENLTGDAMTWTEHTIAGSFFGPIRTQAADLDGDGDLDIACGKYSGTLPLLVFWGGR